MAQRGDNIDASQSGCRSPGCQQGVPQHEAVKSPGSGMEWPERLEQRPGMRAASRPELHYPVLTPISEKLTSNKRAL